ncbi:MAG: hypothetical protein JW760_02000 [Spirochaetales bacterium]|nr:hypothetical protein [Spirochaetales bacterium]
MKKYRYLLILVALVFTVVMTGCNLFPVSDHTLQRLAEQAESAQPLLPVFTAAQSLYEPDTADREAEGRTLNPDSTTSSDAAVWKGKTPLEAYGASTTGIKTFGSEAEPLTDLNGNEGDNYYFELSPYTSDNSIFRVTLRVYPSTSPSVKYVLEEYLVSDDAFWTMVDATGTPDTLAYIRYETHHYDGGVEYRNFIWTGSGANSYDKDDLFNATNDLDPETASSYAYPADPVSAVQPGNNGAEFSILASGTIPEANLSFYEYYSEYEADKHDRRSVTYLFSDMSSIGIAGTEETVRRYKYDATTGAKTVRARTVTEMTLAGTGTTKTTYESIDITGSTYDSTVKQVKDRGGSVSTTTTVIELEKQQDGSYSGTVTITTASGATVYSARLTSAEGLILTDANGNPINDSGYTPVPLEEGQKLITLDLPEGGTLEGILTQGFINGVIRSGRAEDIIVGPTYVQIIYNSNRGRNNFNW